MDREMDSPLGIAMEIPLTDASPALRTPPRRLSRRLSEAKTPTTAQEIDAKLRDAHLRRQQFYEKLSSRARPKPRSPPPSLPPQEDLGHRLEAKLQAAEQKRLNILAKSQMRLARLDELRQAAKTGVELRCQKEREKLGSKVRSRVQQAEDNRMLILKAHRQRRASLKERSLQSTLRRVARESKYKERVRAAIHQKRAAAERKRMGLLEAEKKRARARLLQVQQIATSVSHKREVERRRLRDQLEQRLQRAKRQRAEYLRQRATMRNFVGLNRPKMHKQADTLSRKLGRCWRRFCKLKKTTLDLGKAFDALGVNEKSVKSMPFEHLAMLLESTATLQNVKAFLDRLESRYKVYRAAASTGYSSSLENIDHLLKRVATPRRRTKPRTPVRNREEKRAGVSSVTKRPAMLSRYPVRVVLCAYMILGHPDAVFSGQGEREIALAKTAQVFVQRFELLIRVILEGPRQSVDEELVPKRHTFRSQLIEFDKAWCSYLNCFVAWKVKDARLLEEDLVRAACQLELSMIQTCKLTPEGESGALSHDMKAIKKQVTEDQKLLREKVHQLSGDAGIERMEFALSETRTKYFQAKESGSPLGSPVVRIFSPTLSNPSDSTVGGSDEKTGENSERPSRVVRALFREESSTLTQKSGPSTSRSLSNSQMGSVVDNLTTENEMIVNEYLHEKNYSLTDTSDGADGQKKSMEEKIRKTMQEAFWDHVVEYVKQDEPNFDRIVCLMKEVRDELCGIAPESWKKDIVEAIDLEILSQVLKSGNLDITYLGKILEFSLSTLQKLSSPAMDDEMKSSNQNLMKGLAEICNGSDQLKYAHVIALVNGLRYVLEKIQELKQEIKKARIQMMEPILKGPASFEYLRDAFTKRYGAPSDASASLPLTLQWFSSVYLSKDQEWEEHSSYLLALTSHDSSSQAQGLSPSIVFRTGGSFMVKSTGSCDTNAATSVTESGCQQPECDGGKVDLMVRLGLLKLVSGVSGLTREVLPETFILNLSRLRAVQDQIQKIIVICTSVLVLRQFLLIEQIVSNPKDMESLLLTCSQQLMELVEGLEDIGIQEIVEIMSGFLKDVLKEEVDVEKCRVEKAVMGRMLARSLQAGDPVFEKVSRAVYLGARGVVLGGSGGRGVKLVEMALQPIGAGYLTEKVVKAAKVLVAAATISNRIHGPWYTYLIDSM